MVMHEKNIFRVTKATLFITLFVLVFSFILLWRHIVITIPAGHVGVMWWRFFGGTDVVSAPKAEGIHLIFPWDKIFVYNARTQAATPTFRVVANNGLSFYVSIAIRWSIKNKNVASLHKKIGPNYFDTLIIPNIGSVIRESISQYPAEDVYAIRRSEIQRQIYKNITDANPDNSLGGRFPPEIDTDLIFVEDVLITDVELPIALRTAIDRKFSEAEYVKEYQYRVERELLESKRKEIEANGIKTFQEIVAPTISDSYLRWTGIQATVKLSESPNTKFVIMGNGPGGLPVILNGFEGENSKAETKAPLKSIEKPE
jgi:regulator of protease activity HflC (stomatin/prohibitin superfamily)